MIALWCLLIPESQKPIIVIIFIIYSPHVLKVLVMNIFQIEQLLVPVST